jgi:RecQ-mediated genome instability protein 1
MSEALVKEITSHLLAKGIDANPSWVRAFVGTSRPGVPAAALKQTALFRLTVSDITTTVQSNPNSTFPADVLDASQRERILSGPILVQIIDVEDIGRSRWSQIEAIEADERGETTRGREIIRVVPGEDEDSERSSTVTQSHGPHKLLLQDAKGVKAYGLELSAVTGISTSMNIGAKLVLRDVTVARGVILVDPSKATLLGGKIEELDRKWKAGHKQELLRASQLRE